MEARPLRAVLSIAFLAGVIWVAFTVQLGPRTCAQHIDHIGRTPEAHQLIEGTRARLRPALDEASARVLGEYVEAPTRSRGERPAPPRRRGESARDSSAPARAVNRSSSASTSERTRLPGRHAPAAVESRRRADEREDPAARAKPSSP